MDRNGLRQSYAMLDFRYICPTVLRRIFHSSLGGAGAKLEDMAAAYTAFARYGKAGRIALTA